MAVRDHCRVAFFTHNFLEPTHHAIAQVVRGLSHCDFHVYSKRFFHHQSFDIPNVKSRTVHDGGDLPILSPDCFDLVHAVYDGKTALHAALAARKAGLPFVLSFHGGFDTQAKMFQPRYREWTRQVAEFADAVTVPCLADVQRLRSLGIEREVAIVPVPMDPGVLPPAAQKRLTHRLIAVARLVPKKGIDVALRALAILPGNYSLDIVGDGPLREELHLLSRTLGCRNVQWHGLLSLQRTLSLMNDAGILVHASRVAHDHNADGIPQAILWAMAIRLPVIATNCGSLSELLDGGTRGVLVAPDDHQALANAIQEIASDESRRACLTECAFRYCHSRHSIDAVLGQVNALYEAALSRKKCKHDATP